MTATHYQGAPPLVEGSALCGWLAVATTTRVEDVTCKLCLRHIAALPFPLQPLTDAERAPRTPQPRTVSTETERRALAQSKEIRERTHVWPNVAAAVRYYVSRRDEGASLGSTCNPDRAIRVQVNRDPSLGGREHDAIERYATVARALEHATRMPLAISSACPMLTPEQARDVYLLRVCGRAKTPHTSYRGSGELRKGTYNAREGLTLEGVVDLVRSEARVSIEAWHVSAICAHFEVVVGEILVETGEMDARGRVARKGRIAWDPVASLAAKMRSEESEAA